MYIKNFESFQLKNFKNNSTNGKFKVDLLEKFTRLEEEKIKNFVLTHNGSSYKSEKNMIGFWIPYKDMKNRKFIRVEKYHDEWFLVTDYPSYYECDQIDGVIDFLETIVQNKTFENTILFNKISNVSRDKIHKKLSEDFTKEEIEIIKNIFSDFDINVSMTSSYRAEIKVNQKDNSCFTELIMRKFQDDWYTVSYIFSGHRKISRAKSESFECDEFTGVIQCLEKIKRLFKT